MSRNRILGAAALIAGLCAATGAWADGVGVPFKAGVAVTFSIYDGYNQAGVRLGDYDCVHRLDEVANGGYRYTSICNGPAANGGTTQTIYPDDNKTGTMLREYFPAGDISAKGYIGYLRVSDAVYAGVKAGQETRFEMDDAENPHTVRKIGEEDLQTLVNEKPVTIHTIKVQGASGGTFWIADDPAFPMLVRGETKWKWMATAIRDTTQSNQQLVADLKSTGIATTHAILFDFNSAAIQPQSKAVIDSVAQYLKANPAVKLEIQGHTDSIGGADPNRALSEKRAAAVKAALVAAGVAPGRLSSKGFGLTTPVADNATPEGRAQNRRVVFKQL